MCHLWTLQIGIYCCKFISVDYSRMTTTMLIILNVVLNLILVDGLPVSKYTCGSCCKVKESNPFTFSVSSSKSAVYNIVDFCGDYESIAEAYCDATTGGGGWLVIQRRKDGSVDFDRDWIDYEEGFGNLTGEFWYGLRPIHCLTNQGQWELRVDYMFANETARYFFYKNFKVGIPSSQYQLTISGYSGYTPDPSTHSLNNRINSMKFTSRDRDNDQSSGNCAGNSNGGWWYNTCSTMRLNNLYSRSTTVHINGRWYGLKFIEMKIRPTSCSV